MNKLFKVFTAILAVATMSVLTTACNGAKGDKETPAGEESEAKYTAGTYSAEAQGYGGPIKVDVTVDETSITSVEIVENAETEGIGSVAVEEIPPAIVEAQSADVEIVSGCTVSSTAIIDAVKSALEEANV